MKRFLALLLLAVAPAFAQELPPTYVNSGNIINSTYPNTYGFADGVAPFEQVGIGGVVMDPDDWDGDGFYYQFSFMPGAIIAEIDISALQLNSLEVFLTSFAFKTDCNNQIGGSCEDPFGTQDWIRSRMELFTTEGLFGSYNMFNSGDGTYYSYTGTQWVGAFNYVNKDMVDLKSETAYFTSARLIVEGLDVGFWGGLYGPKIDSLNLQIEYDTAAQGLTPIAPDCTINPNDPTCIINDLIDFTDEEPVMLADTSADSVPVDKEEDSAPEELLAAEESIDEELVTEKSLEELLADDNSEENNADEELVAEVKELVNEEKAETLSDSISKDVLGAALSIAADAIATTATSGSSDSSSSSSSSSSRSSSSAGGSSELVADTSSSTTTTTTEINQESSSSSSESVALEILETGRQIGQEALASTMAATEASASDSLSQAENIAFTSSSDSMSVSSTVEAVNSIQIDNVIEVTTTETATESTAEVTMMVDNTSNTESTSSSMANTEFSLVENNPSAAAAQEAEDVALAVVNNSIAASEQKTFDDEFNKDAETTTALVDPALAMANTFNQPPSLMNLEILGIVKPVEEKSDAEIRAEQVVAANKEQQDAINANYMDADQSGIVAAIGADADVSSYLSQRLTDVPFYRPEDIYKNIVYKDNVRGAYFLEKGNTDTYKKMVEEQYKDE